MASRVGRSQLHGLYSEHLAAQGELLARNEVSLDLSWLRDESLEDSANLPPPDVLAQEIVEEPEAAISEFAQIAESLRPVEGG